jgi:hypothetical protein
MVLRNDGELLRTTWHIVEYRIPFGARILVVNGFRVCASLNNVYVYMSSVRDIYVNDLAGSEHRIARKQPTFSLHNHMRVGGRGINVFIFRNEAPGVIFQAQPSVWFPVHPASCLCLSVCLFVTLHPVGECVLLFYASINSLELCAAVIKSGSLHPSYAT